jgi:hypothetical protein
MVRSSNGTFSDVRSAVQRADTNRTNCKSGIPEFWISKDGMAEHYRWRPARSQRAKGPSGREKVQVKAKGEMRKVRSLLNLNLDLNLLHSMRSVRL